MCDHIQSKTEEKYSVYSNQDAIWVLDTYRYEFSAICLLLKKGQICNV